MKPTNSATKIPLRVTTEDENTLIRILDNQLREIKLKQNMGDVEVRVEPGVYAVELKRGREVFTRPVLVMEDAVHLKFYSDEEPAFASAAPVEGTSTSREWHQEAAANLSRATPLERHTVNQHGYLLVFVRSFQTTLESPPEISVHDIDGNLLFDLAGDETEHSDGCYGQHITLDPGSYRIRRQTSRSFYEQIVYIVADWQTQLFLLYESAETISGTSLPRISLLMSKPYAAFMPERQDILWTESALRALEDGTSLPGRDTAGMFRDKFENPMLGIYAGLLHLRKDKINPELLHTVFRNLIKMIGPLPDVLAIGWGLARCNEASRKNQEFMAELNNPQALSTPPMLRESWFHLTLASSIEPEVFEHSSFTAKVAVNLTTSRPWLIWEGEPPELEVPSLMEIQGRSKEVKPRNELLSRMLKGFKDIFSAPTISFLLPLLQHALKGIPDVGYRLRHPDFTQLERSIAMLLDPLVDPTLVTMIEKSTQFKKAYNQARKDSKAFDTETLIAKLNLPPPTIMSSMWGLYSKLFMKAMPPLKIHLKQFVQSEDQDSPVMSDLLHRLSNENTPIIHKYSSTPLNALQFLFLRYRGRPGFINTKVTVNSVIDEINKAGYQIQEHELNPELIGNELTRIRNIFISWVEISDFNDRSLMPEWPKSIFIDPNNYQRGNLLSGVLTESSAPPTTEEWTELQLITGIGPKIQNAFLEEGITELGDLANIGDETLNKIEKRQPGVRKKLDKMDWRRQARKLSDSEK